MYHLQENRDTYSEPYSRLRQERNETIGPRSHPTSLEEGQQHLILRHSSSGNLYYSKLPPNSSTSNYLENQNADIQLRMPNEGPTPSCFLRWFLTLLHAVVCLVSGFCTFFSLFSTYFSDHCLPHIVNKDGSFVISHFGFTSLCEGVLFGLASVFLLSLVMCGLVQISLNKTWLVVFSLFLATCMAACSVMAGSMFTVHYSLWCDSIAQTLSYGHASCDIAAAHFDMLHKSSNMASFQSQMQIQQITAWTLFPLTFMVLLCYAVAMRWGQVPTPEQDIPPPRGFYQYLASQPENREPNRPTSGDGDERTPFLQ